MDPEIRILIVLLSAIIVTLAIFLFLFYKRNPVKAADEPKVIPINEETIKAELKLQEQSRNHAVELDKLRNDYEIKILQIKRDATTQYDRLKRITDHEEAEHVAYLKKSEEIITELDIYIYSLEEELFDLYSQKGIKQSKLYRK